MKLDQNERDLIELAIANLEKQYGVQQYADSVRRLLNSVEAPPELPWVDEDLIGQIVRVLYPPRDEWTDEVKARHFRLLTLALKLNHDLLTEDIKEILKREQHD